MSTKLPDNSEIEFKFKIYENDIYDLLANVKKNSNFEIVPCFDIYSDFYYKNKNFNINNVFVRKRLVTSFESDSNDSPYPLKDANPTVNYCKFLRDGIKTFIEPKTGELRQYLKDVEYTMKRKRIVDGIETNEEYEVKCCEDDKEMIEFINQLLIDNDYKLYFQKQKRKAFYVTPNHYLLNEGLKILHGCRVEIVSVAKDYDDYVNDFYAEVEFTSARLKGQKEIDIDEVNETLQTLPLILLGVPFHKIELISDSWDKILEKQNG